MRYTKREQRVFSAFKKDKWDTETADACNLLRYKEGFGIAVQHLTAARVDGFLKKAYYVEGSAAERGHLMGLLAEPEIADLSSEKSIHEILKSFIGKGTPDRFIWGLQRRLQQTYGQIRQVVSDNYPEMRQELEGMVRGCTKANPATTVSLDRLWQINVGFDALLPFIYTRAAFDGLEMLKLLIQGKGYRLPILCNGFSVYGGPNRDPYHYMGRDFMFPTGGIMQKYIAPIIHRPRPNGNLFVGIGAPGIVGCFTAMNAKGVGIGVDMSPAGNCDTDRPGMNSLLVNRDAVQYGKNLQGAIDRIAKAPRGVSWIHILADGSEKGHSACVVEAGMRYEDKDHFIRGLLSCPPGKVMHTLDNEGDYPKKDGVRSQIKPEQLSATYKDGLMVRTPDFRVPQFYESFNEELIEEFRNDVSPEPPEGNRGLGDNDYNYRYFYDYRYDGKDWSSSGMLNRNVGEKKCPMSYYFAPTRNEWNDERDGNILVATNFFMIPEMRICQMHPASAIIGQNNWDEMQWRYDKLINILGDGYDQLDSSDNGRLKAREMISYLSPLGVYADAKKYYYETNSENKNKQPIEIEVQGAVSLMDLKKRTIESLYGNYGDEWVMISLDGYK